jgi:Fe-S cluster assembly ATP-binding protein|tara:strand:+ start:2527 stop:3270 length:744 start_codon:yes stop_codon:yes gene_type:complete
MLDISNLQCQLEDGTQILKGVDLKINKGEIHAIMGPNGSGKSTLSKVLAGHADYEVSAGKTIFNGVDLEGQDASERANMGIFMGFQYPVEIPGVNNVDFLKMALNAKAAYHGQDQWTDEAFKEKLNENMKLLNMDGRYRERALNSGFSGGEKKRNEILQLAMLEPTLAVLDETDSGLDIDALRIVAGGINAVRDTERSIILITHYQRLLDYVKPDFVHVLNDGKIIKSGGPELALELEEQGYDWLVS